MLTASKNHNLNKRNQLLFSLKKGLAWAGITIHIVGGTVAGIWTLIPTNLLPWGASQMNLIGYISHCSFAPISSLLLFGFALFGVLKARKRIDLKYNGLIVIGFGITGVILGAINTISLNMLILGLVGICLGMIFVAGVELLGTNFTLKRMNKDIESPK